MRIVGLAFVVFAAVLLASAAPALGADVATTPGPVSAAVGAAPAAQVTLSLAEFERLTGGASITVVESLRISGSFAAHDLQLQISGRSAGKWPRVEFLHAASGLSLYGCEGDAIIGRSSRPAVPPAGPSDEVGQPGFELLPLAARFHVRCRLALANSDRLQVDTTAAVLWLESQVSDGELSSLGSVEGLRAGTRRFQVVRVSSGTTAVLPLTAMARYRISLQPESTQFVYVITAWNPNRQQQALTLSLRNGEHVQKVEASVHSEPLGNSYRFEIPPGEQTLSIVGTLATGDATQGSFRPPLLAPVHYILVDSHPLLRPAIQLQGGQRISPAETGLTPQHRGAQGFAIRDSDVLSWRAQRLESIHATSFALPLARHTFFLSGDGQVLGETQLRIDNEGAAALSMPMHAAPSFASLQGAPILLTQDENGSLWIPLGSGPQEVLVQHRQQLRRAAGLALATLWLPELPVAASQNSVELRFGQEWLPLYVELAPELRLPPLGAGWLLAFVLLLLWSERLLALLSLRFRRRLWLAAALSLSALILPWALLLVVVANLGLSVTLAVGWLSRRRFTLWTAVFALCLGGLVFLLGAMWLVGSRPAASPPTADPVAASTPLREARPSDDSKPDAVEGKSRGKESSYEGLPAKFTLPYGQSRSTFHRELLATSPARPVYALLLSQVAADLLGVLLFAVAALLLLAQRRLLYLGFVDLWERLHKRAEPARGRAEG